MIKIAVYTAIFGEKDIFRESLNYRPDSAVDYFLITDNRNITSDIYTVIFKEIVYQDIAKNARYYKILGLERFKAYDYVIWHDANLQVKHDTIQDLIGLVMNKQIAAFKHPRRTNFYDEAIACIKDKKEEPLILLYQCSVYFFRNYSPYSGLYETGILVKNINNCQYKFYEKWWEQVERFSRRDQVSFPVMLNRYKMDINILEGEGRISPYAIYHEHSYYKYHSGKRKLALPRKIKKVIMKFIAGLKVISRRINSIQEKPNCS